MVIAERPLSCGITIVGIVQRKSITQEDLRSLRAAYLGSWQVVVPGAELIALQNALCDITACELHAENGFPELLGPTGRAITEDGIDFRAFGFANQ